MNQKSRRKGKRAEMLLLTESCMRTLLDQLESCESFPLITDSSSGAKMHPTPVRQHGSVTAKLPELKERS